MFLEEGYITFEDGCQCTPHEFWLCRSDESFENGWSIWIDTTVEGL